MRIGIIGAGGIGQAFATHVAHAGFEVIVSNSRGPQSLAGVVQQLGGTTRAGTRQDAAQADVVFVSVPFPHVSSALSGLPQWEGRILIDATNAVGPGFRPLDLGGKTSSEVVASNAPGARVVKAVNTLPRAVLAADPREAGGQRVLFLSGDDSYAKKEVRGILEKAGFATIDLGGLSDGGRLQEFPGSPLATLNLIKLG